MAGTGSRPFGIWLFLGLGILVVAVVLLVLALGSAGLFGGGHPHAPFFGDWGGFLLLFLILWVAFFLVRVAFWTSRRRAYGTARPDYYERRGSAFAIARQRYARGEITREQFDQIMTDLSRRRTPP